MNELSLQATNINISKLSLDLILKYASLWYYSARVRKSKTPHNSTPVNTKLLMSQTRPGFEKRQKASFMAAAAESGVNINRSRGTE